MTVQIAGVASTPFGEHPDSSTRELFTDATLEALEGASLSAHDIEELYAGDFIGDPAADTCLRRCLSNVPTAIEFIQQPR